MNTWRGPSAVTASTADASPASATAFGVFRLVSARLESISFLSFLGSPRDRKSTRLNSSHSQISYAVFCLKKKQFNPGRLAGSQNQATESENYRGRSGKRRTFLSRIESRQTDTDRHPTHAGILFSSSQRRD